MLCSASYVFCIAWLRVQILSKVISQPNSRSIERHDIVRGRPKTSTPLYPRLQQLQLPAKIFYSALRLVWVQQTLVLLSAVLIITVTSLSRAKRNPLLKVAGPPVNHWFGNQLSAVLDPSISCQVYQRYISKYGRSIRIRGVGFWDNRLLTLDPLSISYVLKNTSIYQKPWQSRKLIASLIGCGMLAAEGQTHKRQRRVATPAFSVQNLQALIPLVFQKGLELREKWVDLIERYSNPRSETRIDVCHWISRATFDVVGVAGFDYNFRAIQDESNELLSAYKDMFEVAVSQTRLIRTLFGIYLPWITIFFPDKVAKTVQKSQSIIRRVGGQLIKAKKQKILEAKHSSIGNDLLSLLRKFKVSVHALNDILNAVKSNLGQDISPDQRISDEDILNNINTFMFAGSDTSSLAVTWTLYLLAQNPDIQDRLRQELLCITPQTAVEKLTDQEVQSLYDRISSLPFLHNVTRESLRLIPPVHSSIRVATQDDKIPTAYGAYQLDGSKNPDIAIRKGTLIHVAIEGFNLDKEMWGDDAWAFNPDRWDNLPENVANLPGLFSNTLTFSAGPRSCIGMRFSLIEIKMFLYLLVTHFNFKPTEEQIFKANVVLTRPYIRGRYQEGSQCPLVVEHIRRAPDERMLSFQQQQNASPNGAPPPSQSQAIAAVTEQPVSAPTLHSMRLREEPPPITPAPRNSRKRKSPSNNADPSQPPPQTASQPIQHLPPPHALMHPIPGPLPGYSYPPADYTPGGMPPGQPAPPSGVQQAPSPTSSGRTLSQSKRAEQNRKAQRAFRERRDQHVKALESRSQLLDAALASADEANRRWEECRALVDQLRVENAALRAALSQAQMLPSASVMVPATASAPTSNPGPNPIVVGVQEEKIAVAADDVKHNDPRVDSGKD
ncbi:hypothetical protein APHAL10511_000056 [Amanita phalloides]|nr:hypothetical protein APHAL10511_000056 [Amanita phalloides]